MAFAVGCLCLTLNSAAQARDAFDRLHSAELSGIAEAGKPIPELTMQQAGKWKTLAPKLESPCVALQTSGGNWTKALLTWGFRKAGDKPVPVLMIERFVTYSRTQGDSTVAHGDNVMLFPGFSFDFDLGQVVPADQGPDVELTRTGALKVLPDARLFGVDGPPKAADGEAGEGDPNDHEGVLPEDFAGSWKVDADGRWQGTCELTVNEEGGVTGEFFSKETQSTYSVTGKAGRLPHQLRFEVRFTNAVLVFDANLWTTDKSAMAGTVTLTDRKFGFYAVREEEGDNEKE